MLLGVLPGGQQVIDGGLVLGPRVATLLQEQADGAAKVLKLAGKLPAALRLDETVAFRFIVPLHGARSHSGSFHCPGARAKASERSGSVRCLERSFRAPAVRGVAAQSSAKSR
jgi:hypothetical protein